MERGTTDLLEYATGWTRRTQPTAVLDRARQVGLWYLRSLPLAIGSFANYQSSCSTSSGQQRRLSPLLVGICRRGLCLQHHPGFRYANLDQEDLQPKAGRG